eukprot:7194942-Prymnesium_polylepis.1
MEAELVPGGGAVDAELRDALVGAARSVALAVEEDGLHYLGGGRWRRVREGGCGVLGREGLALPRGEIEREHRLQPGAPQSPPATSHRP